MLAINDLDADPTNFNSTLSAGAENATDITALENANGNGTINGSALTAINGTYAEIVQAILTSIPIPPTSTPRSLLVLKTAADITAHRGRQRQRHHQWFGPDSINGTAAAVVQAIADVDTDPTNFNSTLQLVLQMLISLPSRPPTATAPSLVRP